MRSFSRHKFLKNNILPLFLLLFTTAVYAQQHAPEKHEKESEPFNFSEMIIHHVTDSHEWHLATIGHTHYTIPLPVILYSPDHGLEIFSSSKFHGHGQAHAEGKHEHSYQGYYIDEQTHKIKPVDEARRVYDFSITKNVMSMFFSLTLISILFITIANRYKKNRNQAPKGIQALLEPVIVFLRDEVVRPNIGEKHYERFLPYMLMLFFFILINNLLGLLPGGANVTGNIAVTFTLAILTLILTLLNAKRDYWKHIFAAPGVPVWLLPIMVPVEILGIFTKPLALMIRLFANITGGHIVILSFLGLIFLFKNVLVAGASIPLVVAMNFLELLVAFLQAYIFTLLSSMYIGSAVEEHGQTDHGH